MRADSWKIYWNEYAANSYIYGSEINYIAKDHVEFFNSMMPPGTVINEWYSRTNFQGQKMEPELPIIDGEGQYEIEVAMESNKKGGCLIRIVFLDKYDDEAGDVIVHESKAAFRCPLRTYSYKVQLISAGVSHLDFHYLIIRELFNER